MCYHLEDKYAYKQFVQTYHHTYSTHKTMVTTYIIYAHYRKRYLKQLYWVSPKTQLQAYSLKHTIS